MTNYWKWLGVWVLLAVPATALAAEGLSYNYVEAVYININEGGDGFGLRASGQVGENIFLFAGYTNVETDSFDVETESGTARAKLEGQTIAVGVGYRMPLQSGTDLNASVDFVDVESGVSIVGGDSFSEDDTGFGLDLGVRHLFTPRFEGGAGIRYIHILDDGGLSFPVSGLFHVTSALSLGASYTISDGNTIGDGGDVWALGGRLNF